MSEHQTTDAALAAQVRAAAEAFNHAVDEARVAGISVGFSTRTWTGCPSCSHVADLWIKRLADWDKEIDEVKL